VCCGSVTRWSRSRTAIEARRGGARCRMLADPCTRSYPSAVGIPVLSSSRDCNRTHAPIGARRREQRSHRRGLRLDTAGAWDRGRSVRAFAGDLLDRPVAERGRRLGAYDGVLPGRAVESVADRRLSRREHPVLPRRHLHSRARAFPARPDARLRPCLESAAGHSAADALGDVPQPCRAPQSQALRHADGWRVSAAGLLADSGDRQVSGTGAAAAAIHDRPLRCAGTAVASESPVSRMGADGGFGGGFQSLLPQAFP
jgi:hypothetical protein